ncbi:hypothetical protein HY637_05505 [Candidatus Woesearchaeota archaeon]|nr:hypothetical protein [Candidatus Woesearchaeota archaeon]
MRKTAPKKKLYKIIGMCRHCRERFVVDMGQKYASRNYCKKCTDNFKKGRN